MNRDNQELLFKYSFLQISYDPVYSFVEYFHHISAANAQLLPDKILTSVCIYRSEEQGRLIFNQVSISKITAVDEKFGSRVTDVFQAI